MFCGSLSLFSLSFLLSIHLLMMHYDIMSWQSCAAGKAAYSLDRRVGSRMTVPTRHFSITGCCNSMWPSVNFSSVVFNARKLNMFIFQHFYAEIFLSISGTKTSFLFFPKTFQKIS